MNTIYSLNINTEKYKFKDLAALSRSDYLYPFFEKGKRLAHDRFLPRLKFHFNLKGRTIKEH